GYDTNPEDDTSPVMDVGADLEAIENVCADDPASDQGGQPSHEGVNTVGLAADEVEGLLERLVEQSLVTVHITPTTVRYSLLESIRLFTRQRLEERSTHEVDEPARLARRHRHYYRDKVVAAQRDWFSPAEQDLLDWARVAADNITIAIETSFASGDAALGLEVSTGLVALPIYRGSPREICRWIERTLQATRTLTPQPLELQIEAMTGIGWLALIQGRNEDAERIFEECAALGIRDPNLRANWRQTPETDCGLPAALEFFWGVELMFAHRDPRAVIVLARAREKFRAVGDPSGEGRSEWHGALAANFLGSAQQALHLSQQHLEHATGSGARWATSWAELVWAIALSKYGDPTEALTIGRSTLANQEAVHDQWGASLSVLIRIWALAKVITNSIAAGGADRAELTALATETAQLAGGVATLRAGPGVYFGDLGLFADETNKAIDIARRVLGGEAFVAAQQQGSRLRPEFREVQHLALGTLSIDRMPPDSSVRADAPPRWDELSTAEQEVAILAAAGWTNTAIAARRGISRRTVDAQMAAIFQKLTITSRTDVIELVPEQWIGQVRAEAAIRPPARRRAHRKR
ncbi:LuxR C-terminal-related transcriptional regulator, partial [Nocardia sp. NPDC049190]|uniref:LuxR C-terminal-related transcriptional regulator n=1 Tax=Nocardia sp. NPDC049190 TaxID=3155650 RepID=UPI0033F979B5